jgi:DNA-binding transcriptional LysR family regulator
MRLRHIEVFRALMLTHSVTRAAELLHTSQPTASRFLGDLEREIGFKLFNRTGGKLTPTPEAEALYAEVQRSFSGLDRIAEVAAGIAGFRGDTLRISSIPAFSLGVLIDITRRFREPHEGVAITLEVNSFNEVVRNVAANQSEIGFVAYPVDHAGLSQHPITQGQSVCAMPAGHRLAAKRSVTAEDLRDEPFISISRNVPSGQHADRIFAEAGVERRIVLETQTAAVACAFVKTGMGVSILDPFTVAALTDEKMIARPFEPGFLFRFSALTRSDRPVPRVARLFLDEVRDAVSTRGRGNHIHAE